MHSVAVCALMVALSRQLGLDAALTRELGMAGLLHDLGKALVPTEVLNKPGKLTDEEFAIIKQHPAEGHRLLVEGAAVGDIPLDVVLHHHEKTDGSGYPAPAQGRRRSACTQKWAQCATSMTPSPRTGPTRPAGIPRNRSARMAEWCKGHFDERVFQAFVKCIGIYPIGSLVKLESGRLGVVIEQSGHSLLTPTVKVFFSTRSMSHIPPD
jgi:HD-GYP domain-containing protein (c-di-GMP phosphodiesterase class II)